MSFLNPVNEPVKRFSSTDAGAPQINYNARVAGDVKAVLKACLVTGYGTKPSAGWSAVNETATVIEFVSPSVAMSDYRLGIDDTSTSSTTWYYQYQNARVNPSDNLIGKSFTNVDLNNPEASWQLIVTERGMFFVEAFYSQLHAGRIARLSYCGQIKVSASDSDRNMAFWSVGLDSPSITPSEFFTNNTVSGFSKKPYHDVTNSNNDAVFVSASQSLIGNIKSSSNTYELELLSPVYVMSSKIIIGVYGGFQLKSSKDYSSVIGVRDLEVNGKPTLHVCVGVSSSNTSAPAIYNTAVSIPLDNWEY